MHIILTGATGQCGAAVLKHCLSSTAVTRLSILSRRPVPQAEVHEKASVIIHEDFTQYPQSLLDKLKGAEGCIWALGISAADVSKKKYIEITHTYTLAAAKAFSSLANPFKFVFVSGEGADPTERTIMFFGKIKGRAEKDLHALSASHPSLRTFAVRPALIDPQGEILARRRRTIIEFAAQNTIAPALHKIWPASVIGTDPLARALADLALGDGAALPVAPGIEAEGRTIRNSGIRKLAGV